jgi:hypothetical protein
MIPKTRCIPVVGDYHPAAEGYPPSTLRNHVHPQLRIWAGVSDRLSKRPGADKGRSSADLVIGVTLL